MGGEHHCCYFSFFVLIISLSFLSTFAWILGEGERLRGWVILQGFPIHHLSFTLVGLKCKDKYIENSK